MADAFIQKLESFSTLSDDDKRLIGSVTRRFDLVAPNTDIIQEGDKPTDAKLIESGVAFRYKLLHRGQRQIVGFLFPGELCDLYASLLETVDHSIAALSATRIVRIARSDVAVLLERPAIARALLMMTLVNESVSRDWLANVGGRRAEQRLAHLLCEWHLRLRMVGLANGGECDFPLTQLQVGDTLGMTSVHVNRSLQSLRSEELIVLRNKRLRILDAPRLEALGDFSSAYMHARNDTQRDPAKSRSFGEMALA